MFFDASEVEPQKAFDPVPPGWYAVTIVGAEEIAMTTPSGEQHMAAAIVFEVDGQEHLDQAGKKIWQRYMLNHPTSKDAADIARAKLSGICHATGKMQLAQIEDLLGLSLRGKVTVRPPRVTTDGKAYDASNDITSFKPLDGQDPAPTKPAAPTAGKPTPTAAAPVRQWKK
jgi:hypothetical protein